MAKRVKFSDARETAWLLPGLLPTGRIVTLSGPSATGKSTFIAGLVGQLTRLGHNVGNYSPEEVVEEDVIGRLKVNRVVLSRFVILERDLDIRDLATLPGLDRLAEVIREHELKFITVDPITSALGIDTNKGELVRPALENLGAVAAATGCTIMLVLHDRKGSALDRGPSADMVKGSQELTAVPRVNIRLALDPLTADLSREETKRLIGVVATNLSGCIGCREALSIRHPEGWEFQWAGEDLDRPLEVVWAEREAEMKRREGSTQRDGRLSVDVSAQELAAAIRANPDLTRVAAAEMFGVGRQTIITWEKAAVGMDLLTVHTQRGGGGGTTYALTEG